MMKKCCVSLALVAAMAMTGALSFAQSGGEATYKAKCAMCHGPAGTPNPSMAKAMGIKPAGDPEMKKLSEAQIIAVIKAGKGKMKPVAGLSEPQVKEVAAYYHSLK